MSDSNRPQPATAREMFISLHALMREMQAAMVSFSTALQANTSAVTDLARLMNEAADGAADDAEPLELRANNIDDDGVWRPEFLTIIDDIVAAYGRDESALLDGFLGVEVPQKSATGVALPSRVIQVPRGILSHGVIAEADRLGIPLINRQRDNILGSVGRADALPTGSALSPLGFRFPDRANRPTDFERIPGVITIRGGMQPVTLAQIREHVIAWVKQQAAQAGITDLDLDHV